MTTEVFATVEVFGPGLAALRAKADKLNKRAAKHGMNVLDVTVVREKSFFPVYDGHIGHAQELYCIEISGCAPRINGWALAARIEFNAIIGNVVRIAPNRCDDGSYSAYRTIGPICEHCNSIRKRNDVFVLEDCGGCRKIVGRNCLADFLRCEGADDFAKLAEYADLAREWAESACAGDDDYESFGGRAGIPAMRLESYLPVVAMLMRRIGWTSRTAAKEDFGIVATADCAYSYFHDKSSSCKAWIKQNELYADAEDSVVAAKAIEWARNVCADGSEYLSVIKRIACEGYTDFGSLDGYAASIIIAYRKACERDAEKAEKAKGARNRVWFGSKGCREKGIRVKCVGTHSFEGAYGVTTIVRFEHYPNDTDKAVLAWFASGDKERDWEVDAEYTIDAMIKDHSDDPKYGKDTKINRVKDVS